MWSPSLLERERSRAPHRPEPEPPQRREHAILALQRGAGNQAVSMLLRENGKGKKGATTTTAGLTEEEKKDKVRILTDWVRFTPSAEFVDQYGKNPPKTKEEYLQRLLKKIRTDTPHIQESLKSKKNMQALEEDDDWSDGKYNATTLKSVVDSTWGKTATGKIGKAWDPFDKHDCVFAAITHVMGYGDKTSDIKVEKAVADAFSHAYGEVEDSILYRMMERLSWPFVKRFEKWADFVAQAGADTFILSENKDSGGTSGHVIVAEPDGATQISGTGAKVKIYDRQSLRFGSGRNDPTFAVYAWRVDLSTKLASEIVAALSQVK